jgi:hypothetical protein
MSYQTPTLVQGPASNTSTITSGTFNVNLSNQPQAGNLLILFYGSLSTSAYAYISGISQTNVAWNSAKVYQPSGQWDAEIWYGVVSANAGTQITITVAGGSSTTGEQADVCEWSGIRSTSPVDQTAGNSGGYVTESDTGTTSTTTQTYELWLGGTFCMQSSTTAQSNPTNGFTMLDGAMNTAWSTSYIGVAYLYKTATSTGAADSGTSFGGYYIGCIATFFAAQVSAPVTYIQHWLWSAKQTFKRIPRSLGNFDTLENMKLGGKIRHLRNLNSS